MGLGISYKKNNTELYTNLSPSYFLIINPAYAINPMKKAIHSILDIITTKYFSLIYKILGLYSVKSEREMLVMLK